MSRNTGHTVQFLSSVHELPILQTMIGSVATLHDRHEARKQERFAFAIAPISSPALLVGPSSHTVACATLERLYQPAHSGRDETYPRQAWKIWLTGNSVARNKIQLASKTNQGFMFGNKKLNWTRLALVIGQ
jgi:hypothetical protein